MNAQITYTDVLEPSEGRADAGNGRGQIAVALLEDYKMKRGLVFGAILVAALAAFELFNFSTTEFALTDFLGAERFLGIPWATILAIAFCGIDFAGLARLFTPERGDGEPVEVWYLLGAWFLGATLNAMATWWAVTLALLDHSIGNEVVPREQMLVYVPLLVAALVWLTRILIIGTFSVAGDRLFSQAETMLRKTQGRAAHAPTTASAPARIIGAGGPSRSPATSRPAGQQRAPASKPARPFAPAHSAGATPARSAGVTRPAPKPTPPSRRAPVGMPDDDFSQLDDSLSFSRRAVGAGHPTNGTNGPKTIE